MKTRWTKAMLVKAGAGTMVILGTNSYRGATRILAGTLRLSKLVAFYDDNGISIDGHVEGWFTDDTPRRASPCLALT